MKNAESLVGEWNVSMKKKNQTIEEGLLYWLATISHPQKLYETLEYNILP